MNDRIHNFYSEAGKGESHFHKVIALCDQGVAWDEISLLSPLLPRGWFELSRLAIEDRVEFTRDFWLSQLRPSLPDDGCEERLLLFFDRVDDISLFLTQEHSTAAFEAHMVYSLKGDRGFFHGGIPSSSEALAIFAKQFGHFAFPKDYLSFLKIHDGFSKYTDTGLIKTKEMARHYMRFQETEDGKTILSPASEPIEPQDLIPFYESAALHCYQCFFTRWSPHGEAGNVYYAQIESFVDELFEERRLDENFAFPTFSEWLLCYLEDTGHL